MATTALGEVARARSLEHRRGVRPTDVVFYALMVVLALIFMFPFLWTLSSSLKTVQELFDFPPPLLPKVPQFRNYVVAINTVPMVRWIGNSVLVVVLATLGTVLSSSVAAFSFARFKYRGRDLIFMLTLATLMLPGQVTLIPQFILFHEMNLIDTLYPLWVPFWFGGTAFYIFLLRQFLMTIPADLDEAALIDGASYPRVFWTILLPLCKPALATCAVISFINQWNEFNTPLVYLNTPEKFTIALGLSFYRNVPEQGGMPMQHLLMAASVMAIAPCLVLFFSAQRYFVQGIVLSGLKG
ncbi:MAG TPA: carbohydrate ABC transporter permease [Chloroflexota bacterium]|nr:carbohydrate ABC transporter permease [Chloroflexota bacterium]